MIRLSAEVPPHARRCGCEQGVVAVKLRVRAPGAAYSAVHAVCASCASKLLAHYVPAGRAARALEIEAVE